MAFDGITVAALVKELSDHLIDARISKIIQPENDALLVTCKAADGQHRLYLSASASLPLCYLTPVNRQAPLTAPNFCMLVRKHIGGGRIRRITQPGLERIIRFEIEHLDEMGDLCTKTLVVELMGKHSNIIFCDSADQIIDSIKHISAMTSSVREVLPGRTYFIPDTQSKKDPLTVQESDFRQGVFTRPMPLSKALYSTFTGISPVIAEELCHRAGLDSERSALAVSEMEQIHLYHIFSLLIEEVKEAAFSPRIYAKADGEPVEFSALDLSMYHDVRAAQFDTISEVLQTYYEMRDKVTRIRAKSSDLRHITDTALQRTVRKLELQEKQMKDTAKMDKYQLYGEMLHTYGYDAQPGAKELTVLNYYNNEELTIPLDPTLSASENAKRYYDRYTKLKRTAAALQVQMETTRADLAQLESIQTFLNMALNEEDLVQVKEELTQAGYIRAKGPAGKKRKIVSRPYHYRNADGFDFYVGKNNFQNDELTFHFASGGDWWFHSKGAPGSHVILKTDGRDIPDSTFEDAARLAGYYSAQRQAGKAEIDYVQKKEVKKPNAAKPGFVVYYTNYSMVIEPDISHLTLVDD